MFIYLSVYDASLFKISYHIAFQNGVIPYITFDLPNLLTLVFIHLDKEKISSILEVMTKLAEALFKSILILLRIQQ